MSIEGGMDEENTVYFHILSGTLFRYEKKEIQPFADTWMNLAGIKLRKISQTEKDKHHIISLLCGTIHLIKRPRSDMCGNLKNRIQRNRE